MQRRARRADGRAGGADLDAAAAANSDPFTLAALAYYGSKCNPAFHKEAALYGLLAIEPAMYRVAGAPAPPVDKEATSPRAGCSIPTNNLAVGAALLEMWNAKHKELDEAFGGGAAPRRRLALHLGRRGQVERPRGSGPHRAPADDRRATRRRRRRARQAPIGIAVVSPLEGTPRVATSGPGDERDGGARRHRGLDITATIGEPVRAIADGT